MMDWLITLEGVNINSRDHKGQTPLHSAAARDADIVKYLVEHGADSDATSDDGTTALHVCCQSGAGHDAARVLVEYSPDLVVAVRTTAHGSSTGITALHDACESCDTATVEFLLSCNGADVNVATSSGLTPLHVASRQGAVDIVRSLLAHRARLDSRATDGRGTGVLPIHLAADCNQSDALGELIKAGADVTAVRSFAGREGVTCLHLAAMKHSVDVLKYVVTSFF